MRIVWLFLVFCTIACTSSPSGLAGISNIIPASEDDVCSFTVRQAYFRTQQQCADVSRNQVCYGNTLVNAQRFNTTELTRFEYPGDIVEISDISSLRLSTMDTVRAVWGIARMNVQASLPDAFPQDVEILLFGDVNLSESRLGETSSMQAFLFTSGTDDAGCSSAPESGILIQTPSAAGEINFLINEVDIRVGSTLFIQADENFMTIYTLDGLASATAFDVAQPIPRGALVRIPLENGVASGVPQPPEIMDYESVQNLPLDIFSEPVVVSTLTPAPITFSPELETALENVQVGDFLLVGLAQDELDSSGLPAPYTLTIEEPDANGQFRLQLVDGGEVLYEATMQHNRDNIWRSESRDFILSFDGRDKQGIANDICIGNPLFSGVFIGGFNATVEAYRADIRTTCIGDIADADVVATLTATAVLPTATPTLTLPPSVNPIFKARVQSGNFAMVGLNATTFISGVPFPYALTVGEFDANDEFSVEMSTSLFGGEDFYSTTMRHSSENLWVSEDALLTLTFLPDSKGGVRNDVCTGSPMFTGQFSGENAELGGLRIEMYRYMTGITCIGQTTLDWANNGTYTGTQIPVSTYGGPREDCPSRLPLMEELTYTQDGLFVTGFPGNPYLKQMSGVYGFAGVGGGSEGVVTPFYMTLDANSVLYMSNGENCSYAILLTR